MVEIFSSFVKKAIGKSRLERSLVLILAALSVQEGQIRAKAKFLTTIIA